MPGPFTFFVWLLGFFCEAAVLVCAIKRKAVFRRYLLLNLYMAGAILSELVRFKILSEYGFSSKAVHVLLLLFRCDSHDPPLLRADCPLLPRFQRNEG